MVPQSQAGAPFFYPMASNELNELRAQVLARQKAADRKINRLDRNGVDIAGTKFDPRRDPANIGRYTARQARAAFAQLNTFTDRKTQYVQWGNGDITTAKVFNEYKKAERRYNNRVNKNYQAVENTPLPTAYDSNGKLINPKSTIGRRMKTVVGEKRTSRGARVNAVYEPPERKANQIANPKSARFLKRDLEKRVNTDAENKKVRKAQVGFGKMNNVIKDKDLEALINALTPQQFKVLWNFTTFADDVGIPYLQLKKKLKEGKSDQDDDEEDFAAALEIAKDAARWAKKLDVK